MHPSLDALPRWNLATVYPDLASPAFRRDLEALPRQVTELDALFTNIAAPQGPPAKVNDDLAATFDLVATRYDAAVLAAWKLDSYIAAVLDTDADDAVARTTEGEVGSILARLTVLGQHFAAWVGDLDIEALLSHSALARRLTFPLRRMVEHAGHVLPEAEESLVAELHLCGGTAWCRLRRDVTVSMRARLREGDVERLLSMGELRAVAGVPDRSIRRAAYEAECAAWSASAVPLAAALNGLKGEAAVLGVRRGWQTPLDEALWGHGLDRLALEALVAATREALPDFRRFLRAKARLLGLPVLAWYDLTAPVGESGAWTFAEAEVLVAGAFRGFAPAMGDFADLAFRERWIDAAPRPGKQGGGLCYWLGDGVSRIRLEFRPGYDGVRTLAHELGHAYHAAVLAKAGRMALEIQATPPPLWETASKFCEQLVRREAVRRADEQQDAGAGLALLDGYLVAAYRSVVEALALFLFEDRLFARRLMRELTIDELNDLMREARAETSGDALDPDALFPWTWAALPHLYLDGAAFYNLPYLIAHLFAIGLAARYDEDRDTFRRTFADALAATGAEPPAALAGRFGIDLGSIDFWRAGLRIIATDIDRYEVLAAGAIPH
jgi:oligoendopeptidase F